MTLLFVTITIIGCSSGARVGGRVLYDSGEPVAWGVAVFEADKNIYRGRIQNDGRFSLGGITEGEPIPFGKYKVWFSSTERVAENGDDLIPQLTEEFTSSEQTQLFAEIIPGGTRRFDFTVKRHPNWNKQPGKK